MKADDLQLDITKKKTGLSRGELGKNTGSLMRFEWGLPGMLQGRGPQARIRDPWPARPNRRQKDSTSAEPPGNTAGRALALC